MRKQVPLTLAHCKMYESMSDRLDDEETNQMIAEMVFGVVAGVGCFAATVVSVGAAAPVCIAGTLVEMGLMGSDLLDKYRHIEDARVPPMVVLSQMPMARGRVENINAPCGDTSHRCDWSRACCGSWCETIK